MQVLYQQAAVHSMLTHHHPVTRIDPSPVTHHAGSIPTDCSSLNAHPSPPSHKDRSQSSHSSCRFYTNRLQFTQCSPITTQSQGSIPVQSLIMQGSIPTGCSSLNAHPSPPSHKDRSQSSHSSCRFYTNRLQFTQCSPITTQSQGSIPVQSLIMQVLYQQAAVHSMLTHHHPVTRIDPSPVTNHARFYTNRLQFTQCSPITTQSQGSIPVQSLIVQVLHQQTAVHSMLTHHHPVTRIDPSPVTHHAGSIPTGCSSLNAHPSPPSHKDRSQSSHSSCRFYTNRLQFTQCSPITTQSQGSIPVQSLIVQVLYQPAAVHSCSALCMKQLDYVRFERFRRWLFNTDQTARFHLIAVIQLIRKRWPSDITHHHLAGGAGFTPCGNLHTNLACVIV